MDIRNVLAYIERDLSVSREFFTSNTHKLVINNFFMHGLSEEAKAYFESLEQNVGSMMDASIYEEHITRLLRMGDTVSALRVIQLLELKHGLRNLPEVPLPGYTSTPDMTSAGTACVSTSNIGETDSIAAKELNNLLSSNTREATPDGLNEVHLDSIIDRQLQMSADDVDNTGSIGITCDTGRTERSSSVYAGGTPPDLRLLYSTLYSKVINVYRMSSRTADAKDLVGVMRKKNLTVDVSQAHSLMDLELKSRNPYGAVELYESFFTSCSPRSFGDNFDDKAPDVKAVTALAKALVRIAYPDELTSTSTSDTKVLSRLRNMHDRIFEDLCTAEEWERHRNSVGFSEIEDGYGSIGILVSKRDSGSALGCNDTSASVVKLLPAKVVSRACFALPYIRLTMRHLPEMKASFRTHSVLYGTMSRFARLAADAGDLRLACDIFSLIPHNERRHVSQLLDQ